ncbi:MAG TPA: hypothetical protein VNJ10_05970 [Sphingomonas sp.]|nr:hypothetical protein [Sphingomonas sp.]
MRRVIGAKVRSSVLRDDYQAWADTSHAASMTYRELRAMMEAVGHSRTKSNGINYRDVALIEDAPDVPDTLGDDVATRMSIARAPREQANPSPLVAKVDAALSALLDLRAALTAADDAKRPHEAAQRVLGLFDR